MKTKVFIGREKELEKLQALKSKAGPCFVVIKGRRRIGKSRLVAEFAAHTKSGKLWSFAGLAPQEKMTAQLQRDHFARQLAVVLNLPPLTFQDWSDAFEHLSLHIKSGDIVLFDEISWMGANDASFISKLKAWWDKQTTSFILVCCGSVSTWIEDNILKNTAFFGRIHLTLTLEPLSIPESVRLIKNMGFQGSPYDTYKLISVLGGIPWYLEQVGRGMTADQVLKQLCFEKDGLLVLEFDRIFHDLFNGKGAIYKRILTVLSEGERTLAEIRKAIDFAHSGTLSELMEHLVIAGFIKKQMLWSFKTTQPLKQSLYRICDPYIRFYLKVMEPHRAKIELGAFDEVPLSALPGFEAHLGLQIEYLLLQNRSSLLKSIGVFPADIVGDGPYRQSKSTRAPGCQIDYLLQTATKNLFLCEFKFKRQEIGIEIIQQIDAKIKALKVPRGYAVVPVLFHLGGVSASLETAGYFYRVIDITNFLEYLL
jgi:uncharacterized protein